MEKDKGWRRFKREKFDKKNISRHMRKVEGVTLKHAHKFIIGRLDNVREVRRHITIWLVGVGALIGVVGLQMLWFQQTYTTAAPVDGGVYAEAVNGRVDTLNPLYAESGAEISASKLLFSSLYNYDESGHLRGDLATSIVADPNGLTYTVTLRKNAKWHDGYSLTAADVVFTAQLMKDTAVRATPALRLIWKDVNVTQLADNTVKFTLPNPNAAFPQALTFAVLPQHALKNVAPNLIRENSFSQKPVGSGPFAIKRMQLVNETEGRKVIHMLANEKYYRGTPKLSRFQLHVFGSNRAIVNALRTNEVNAAVDLDAADLAQVNKQRYDIEAKPVNGGVYAFLNTTQDILRDKTVRQALQLATNTPELRKQLGGNLQPMDLPIANRQFIDNGDIPKVPAANTARAQALLDQAGWKRDSNGARVKDGRKLQLRVVTVENSTSEQTVKDLADQWRPLGIETIVTVVDPNDPGQGFTQTILQQRDFDVFVNRLVVGGDPDVYAYWHSSQTVQSGRNLSNYSSSISDTALSSALTKSDPVYRDARYKTFAKQWLEDVPAIGLYETNMYYVHSKNSQTITSDEVIVTQNDRFGGVVYWTVEKDKVYRTP